MAGTKGADAAALIAAMIIGEVTTDYSNSNAYLGVGDSSTAENASHTDLQAASNKLRKAMAATYPQRSTAAMSFRSVFANADAVWDWNEVAIFNASSSGVMLVRHQVALGTKPNDEEWTLTVTATVS